MKITKIVFGVALALLISSCGATKKSNNSLTPDKKASVAGKSVISNAKKETDTKKTDIPKNEAVKNTQKEAVRVPARKRKLTPEEMHRWAHMDIYKDSIPGMSLDKAYAFLKERNRKGETVIVAVIDSGIDIEHEDLKNNVWTNEDEIPGNGIDDDKNGYVDDVHGWNFLGGAKGAANPEQLEITRIVKRMSKHFTPENIEKMKEEGKAEGRGDEKFKGNYARYKELKDKVDQERTTALKRKAYYEEIYNAMRALHEKLTKKFGKEDYTMEDLKTYTPENDKEQKGMDMFKRAFLSGATPEDMMSDIKEGVEYFADKANYMYNVDFNGRVAGDDPYDIKDTHYGNPYIMGSKDKEIHGTHVSGIILAERNNGIGMDGVATNAKLMCVRAVPDGDEYDKDVALAIRYAVDNGARVINMSFGKSYSPKRHWVYDAIKYAAERDVLLVHAAGNDSKNIDVEDNFPNDSRDKVHEFADNMITVGAMTPHYDENICAPFSNYGNANVDIFAPGKDIYATFPKNNYKAISGTSMASPEVAGVAALIRSYYPTLTASEVKHVIMDSGIYFDQKVKQPAERGTTSRKVYFKLLSKTGRILNAYEALKLADSMVKN